MDVVCSSAGCQPPGAPWEVRAKLGVRAPQVTPVLSAPFPPSRLGCGRWGGEDTDGAAPPIGVLWGPSQW